VRIVCLLMAELVYLTLFTVLSGAPNTQSARQTPKYCFLVGHICCIRNIPQYRLSPAEYKQPKLPSSYQLHHLVLRHLSQVVKNPSCSGFEPGTSRTGVPESGALTTIPKSCIGENSNTANSFLTTKRGGTCSSSESVYDVR
jgi:hypothetical protein